MGPLEGDVVQDAIGMLVWLYGHDERRDGSLLEPDGVATNHSNLDPVESFGTPAQAIDHNTKAWTRSPPRHRIA
jgi:hypothetical protein